MYINKYIFNLIFSPLLSCLEIPLIKCTSRLTIHKHRAYHVICLSGRPKSIGEYFALSTFPLHAQVPLVLGRLPLR